MQHCMGTGKTSRIVPSPTYWMSLSHTLHHLSPGSPNGHPESTRTKKKRKKDSQNISRIFEVKALGLRFVSVQTQKSQQGEPNSRTACRSAQLEPTWSLEKKNWVVRNHQVEINEHESEQLFLSFFLTNWHQRTKNKRERAKTTRCDHGRKQEMPSWRLTYPSALHMIYIDSLWRCASESLLTLWITAILLTLFVLVEWELSCKDEILFTFVIKRLWREKEHGANGYICHGHADKITFCTKWDIKKYLQGKLKKV